MTFARLRRKALRMGVSQEEIDKCEGNNIKLIELMNNANNKRADSGQPVK